MHRGSLSVVGTGHRAAGQITAECLAVIRRADKLFFLVDDDLTSLWLRKLNPTAESLQPIPVNGKPGGDASDAMVEKILSFVRRGLRVCAAFAGHPGVYVRPASEAVRRARVEGFTATMFPGISAADCLFADLGVDPGSAGCSVFEATDFLIHRRRFDPRSCLILLQAASIGVSRYVSPNRGQRKRLAVLAAVLAKSYPAKHEIILYESVPYLPGEPLIQRMGLRDLPRAKLTYLTTLFVPPLAANVRRKGAGPPSSRRRASASNR